MLPLPWFKVHQQSLLYSRVGTKPSSLCALHRLHFALPQVFPAIGYPNSGNLVAQALECRQPLCTSFGSVRFPLWASRTMFMIPMGGFSLLMLFRRLCNRVFQVAISDEYPSKSWRPFE